MAIKGSLKEASLPDVLQLLALGQKTGCLSIADRSNFGYIDLAEPLAVLPRLALHGGVELRLGDLGVLDENVAQAIAPVDDRRVADAALVEVDVAEVRAVGDGETPRPLELRLHLLRQ